MSCGRALLSLKKTAEFDIVFKNGVRVNQPLFGVCLMRVQDFCKVRSARLRERGTEVSEGNFTLGFSISKKVGKANKRNLLKRRIRELVRELGMCGVVCIFIARKGVAELGFKELKEKFLMALLEAGERLRARGRNHKYKRSGRGRAPCSGGASSQRVQSGAPQSPKPSGV